MNRRIASIISMLILVGTTVAFAGPVAAQDASPTLTVDKVLVNRTGGVTAMGMVDCSAAVADFWRGIENVPDGTVVLVNVSWTAYQAAGRRTLRADLVDTQASPCWANTTQDVDPGRCKASASGILSPCRWDSGNWGSDGYQYGNGTFKPGTVHLHTVLEGGYYATDADGNLVSIGLYLESGFDMKAVRR